MAEVAAVLPPESAASGLASPSKQSRAGSRGDTPGSRASSVKNDIKRWKRQHEQSAMLHLTELRSAKKVEVKASKETARKLARKIPIELLVKDWLTSSEASIEMRAYMVDKVMPTLILGVEKLLNAVDEKKLASPEAGGGSDPNFNPLTFLGQYLFRNNPRFSNFSEASPYVRGLRQVAEELKTQLFDMEDNRLARIKAEAKRKRDERELQAKLKQQEKDRRQDALMTQFVEWNVPTDNNRVELSLLQNALRSFMEVAEQFPPEIQEVAKFGHPLESTDETGRTLAVKEFGQYLSLYVETLPSEVFEQFMVHMSKCAAAHRASAERENRRIMLTNLFIYCDHSGIGLLDRHRILNLFEQFWDVFEDSKKSFRNPRRWPVVEVDEADDSLSDDDECGVSTILETAREDQEEEGQTECEPPNKSGVEIKIWAGSSQASSRADGKLEEGEEEGGGEKEEERVGSEESKDGLTFQTQGKIEEGGGEKETEKVGAGENAGEGNVEEGGNGGEGEGKAGEDKAADKEKKEEGKAAGEVKKTEGGEEKQGGKEEEEATPAVETSAATPSEPAAAADLTAITEEEEEEEEEGGKKKEEQVVAVQDQTKVAEADAATGGEQQLASIAEEKKEESAATAAVKQKEETILEEEEEEEEGGNVTQKKVETIAEEDEEEEEAAEKKEAEGEKKSAEEAKEDGKDDDKEKKGDGGQVPEEERNVPAEVAPGGQGQDEDDEGFSESKVDTEAAPASGEADSSAVSAATSAKMDPVITGDKDQVKTEDKDPVATEGKAPVATEDKAPVATEGKAPVTTTAAQPSGESVAAVEEGAKADKDAEASKETAASAEEKPAEESKAVPSVVESAEEVAKTSGDEVIQMEDDPPKTEEVEERKEPEPTEPAEPAEKATKEETVTGADPDLARDEDITNEIAKSAVPTRVPLATPQATGRASITFAQGTAFEREKTGLTANSGNRSQSQMSCFDEDNVNVSQFVQLTETFLGELPDHPAFGKLVGFVREGYEETEDEKMERLMKARKEAISANRKVQLDTLFEKWDNDGSGYLDMEAVLEIMMKYKEGQEKEAINKARVELKKHSKYHDSRLSRKEFRTFVNLVIDGMPGTDGFEYFVEFLANNVERSYAERVRGEARKKWLQNITTSAERSGISLDPIFKAIFQSLYRDAEAHGGEKRISANIAMLEKNIRLPHRGEFLLRYTACTPEDAEYVLNKALYPDMNGVSFAAVEEGKPIHVPRVNSHGNVHFWNVDRAPEDREGSFIVVPLKDRKRRVFGILGIDTLADPHSKAIFITHEIQYFQGVGQTFSNAYHLVDMKRKLLRITESAISWIKRRSPHVTEIMVYMVEPGKDKDQKDGKETDFVLRRMMTTDSKGFPIHSKDPPVRLERIDNLFRDYLFKSVDNSETVTADAYGKRQLAFPLRNDKGKAIAVVDISTGALKKLPAHENKETQRMLRLLQQAHKEITREFAGEDKTQVLDAEKDEDTRMEVMFDRLMLMELRENVAKLDSKAYAELRAYNTPPPIVLHILRATLAIFYSDLAKEGEFDDWNKIKSYINADLSQKIQAYDPTAADEQLTSPSVIEDYLKEVPHGEVAKHGSLPAQHLYNWVFVCLSLIEHTRKMRQNSQLNTASVDE